MLPKIASSVGHLCTIRMSLIHLKHIRQSLKLKQEKKQQKFLSGHSTCKDSQRGDNFLCMPQSLFQLTRVPLVVLKK